MKKILLASAFLTSLALGLPSAAEAHSNFKLYFGQSHHGYNGGPGYGYGYGNGYGNGYGRYHRGYNNNRNRISCGEARREVRNRGYHDVRTIECNGSTYTFRGWRNGRSFQLLVNSRSGAVWRG